MEKHHTVAEVSNSSLRELHCCMFSTSPCCNTPDSTCKKAVIDDQGLKTLHYSVFNLTEIRRHYVILYQLWIEIMLLLQCRWTSVVAMNWSGIVRKVCWDTIDTILTLDFVYLLTGKCNTSIREYLFKIQHLFLLHSVFITNVTNINT